MCEGNGFLIHTVSGSLEYDYDNFSYSQEIDISSYVKRNQSYYIRVEEEQNGDCGGTDYHISAIGVFTKTVNEISGYIKSDGLPLNEKKVILQQNGNHKGVTDADGYYWFQNVNPYKTFRIVFKDTQLKTDNIVKSDISASNISGYLFNGDSPLNRKQIILRQKGLLLKGVTDTNGYYQFDGVNPDKTFKIIIKGK